MTIASASWKPRWISRSASTLVSTISFSAVVAFAGCSFTPPGASGEASDGSPPDPTADASPEIDGPESDSLPPDAEGCPTGYVPAHVNVCSLSAPDGPLIIPPGNYTYDTDEARFTNGSVATPPVTDVLNQPGNVEALVWSVDGLDVQNGAVIRLVGSRPLIVGSRGAIAVAGRLDASSDRTSTTNTDRGAGALGPGCNTAERGENDEGGGAGGGGGGFQGAGGRGSDGDSNNGPGPPDGTSSGGNGAGGIAMPTVVRGGCLGGNGGEGDNNSDGIGGSGGGAIELASLVSIEVSGVVEAGGGGGGGGRTQRGGGGGGGSGGYVGLDAPTVTLGGSAILAANGGGGGEGGASNGSGDNGDNAEATSQRADGGDGGGGASQLGDGADGSGSGSPNGGLDGVTANDLREGGGGGGGGGAGWILIRTDGKQDQGATVSPPATDIPAG